MHILTISDQTRGARDFCWATPGELAFPGFVCCRGDGCGCSRAWHGAGSGKASTVLEVVDSPMTRDEVIAACKASFIAGGWTMLDDDDFASIADTMLKAAEVFNPGVLVRPRSAGEDDWTFDPV